MRKLLCILLGVVFLASVMAVAAYAEDQFATQVIPKDKVNAALKYWTKEKMRNAKPYPMPKRKGAVHRVHASPAEAPSGAPSLIEGYAGDSVPSAPLKGKSKAPAVLESPAAADMNEAVAAVTVGYNYPAPHTTFLVLDSLYGDTSTPYPYKTVGKIFFTEAGEEYVCSGASIGGRAVLTAGHCVSDGGGVYHTNWIFVPAYYEEEEPFGAWSATWLITFPEYHNGGDLARDVAFAAVANHAGKKLSQVVGNLGFASSVSRIKHWNMFGYPGDDPWDGEYMVETQASYAYEDETMTPRTTGIGTTQTEGCSGGPWIWKFKPGPRGGGTNYANGVNSYADEDIGEIFSPYFDASVKAMRDKAVAK